MLRGWLGLTHYTLIDLWAQQNSTVYQFDSVRQPAIHSPTLLGLAISRRVVVHT